MPQDTEHWKAKESQQVALKPGGPGLLEGWSSEPCVMDRVTVYTL
jgi:hypothetical protein